jgi:hypothetical protein
MTSLMGTREEWKARVVDYSGGSDHYVFMGGVVNIPATMFGNWPDYFYHSSGDTPDKSDPTQLKRTIILGTLVAATIARLQSESGLLLLERMSAAGLARLDSAFAQARSELRRGSLEGESLKEALNIIRWTAHREKRALQSVGDLLPGDGLPAAAIGRHATLLEKRRDDLGKQLSDFYASICRERRLQPESITWSELEKQARKIVPARNPAFPGTLSGEYIGEKCREQGLHYDFSFTGFQKFEIDAFINGKLNTLDIRNAVSAECGPVDLGEVIAYLTLLEDLGLISMK